MNGSIFFVRNFLLVTDDYRVFFFCADAFECNTIVGEKNERYRAEPSDIAFHCVHTLRAVQLQLTSGGWRTTVRTARQTVDLYFVTAARIVARQCNLAPSKPTVEVSEKRARNNRISRASWKVGRRARSRNAPFQRDHSTCSLYHRCGTV